MLLESLAMAVMLSGPGKVETGLRSGWTMAYCELCHAAGHILHLHVTVALVLAPGQMGSARIESLKNAFSEAEKQMSNPFICRRSEPGYMVIPDAMLQFAVNSHACSPCTVDSYTPDSVMAMSLSACTSTCMRSAPGPEPPHPTEQGRPAAGARPFSAHSCLSLADAAHERGHA